jgi:hypothetical protein
VVSSGILKVIAAGDFTNDSVVDAADYVLWRSRPGTQLEYTDWQSHFGLTTSNTAFTGTAVPEPASASLFAALLIAASAVHRSSRENRVIGHIASQS